MRLVFFFKLLLLALLTGGLISVGHASEVPLPPVQSNENVTHLGKMPVNYFKYQFAPAQSLADGSVLVFAENTMWRVWPDDENRMTRVDLKGFKVPSGPRLGYSNQSTSNAARYASVTTSQGVWLVGPTVEMIRLDGSRISGKLKWPRNNVKAVALADGSIMAVGGLSWPESRDFSYTLKVERLSLDTHGQIRSEELPSVPATFSPGVYESLLEFGLLHLGNNRVLLAGGYFPTVLAWKMDASGVFVAAQHAYQRRGAGVIALPNRKLALLGGRYARGVYGESWGRAAPGISVLTLDLATGGSRPPVWPTMTSGALLERKGRLLAVGGLLHHNHDGSDRGVGTRLVELQELSAAGNYNLAPLPIDAGRTQAAWINDNEALVHVEGASSARQVQWLGVVNMQTGNRSLPLPEQKTYYMSDGIHGRMRLVGFQNGRGWLVNENAMVHWVDVNRAVIESGPRLQRQRKDFSGRVLGDGRVIVAGGDVESELAAARVDQCDTCPVSYVGYGPLMPSRRHELFDPQVGNWRSSAPSRAAGGPVVIFPDGRVAKLGLFKEPGKDGTQQQQQQATDNARLLLEISDPTGSSWRTIPFPADATVPKEIESIALRGLVNDAPGDLPGLSSALFFGIRDYSVGTMDWWWSPDLNAAPIVWKKLGTSMPPYGFPIGEYDSGIVGIDGAGIYFTGGHSGVAAYSKKKKKS